MHRMCVDARTNRLHNGHSPIVNLINKKIFVTALIYVLLIGVFFIEKNSLAKTTAFSNQNLFSTTTAPLIKNIALTFDDGPYGTSTEKILDILKQENIHATFFVIGKNVEKYPDIAKRIVAEGNLIENHSYDHFQDLPDVSTTTFENNIQDAETAIFETTGLKPKLFRPPYGNISAQMYGRLNNEGYKTVMWNVDAADWDYKNSPTKFVEMTIVNDARPNGIIVLHDGRDTQINYPRDNTINALSYIIEQLKSEGYSFVTVDKIIGSPAYFDEK